MKWISEYRSARLARRAGLRPQMNLVFCQSLTMSPRSILLSDDDLQRDTSSNLIAAEDALLQRSGSPRHIIHSLLAHIKEILCMQQKKLKHFPGDL